MSDELRSMQAGASHEADAIAIVVDCDTCGVPMAVLRRHCATPTEWERGYLAGLLAAIDPGARHDDHMQSIPAHYHAHARRP